MINLSDHNLVLPCMHIAHCTHIDNAQSYPMFGFWLKYVILYTVHTTHYIVDGCLVVAIIKVLITSKNVTTDKITSRTELTD